ncbi:MAG: serine/threonine protein kinase [Planctomycetes bacterium]|nr:serine/threonine protein kinase [Planctomycetota bacterium]
MAHRPNEDLERLSAELALEKAGDAGRLQDRLETMLNTGLIDTDTLFRLLEKRESQIEAPPDVKARLFGRLAVEGGFVSPPDLEAALREQQVLVQRGLPMPLGQILQRAGKLQMHQVLELLRRQDKHVVSCPCGKRYLIEHPRPDSRYQCGRCGRRLEAPEPTALPAGTRVGRFEIEAEIGRGATGIVYRARDLRLNRTVALKLLAGHDAQRFRREAAAIARLRHPHIVAVHEADEADGRQYVAMDLLEGRTLDQADLGRRQAVEVLLRVARAVAYAHEQGVVHRDLRPRNIIVQRTRRGVWPFVLDFAVPPPDAPADLAADCASLAAILRSYAGGDKRLLALAAEPPASAERFAEELRTWLEASRPRRREEG